MAPSSARFRADIEGLRAVAILLVVASHYAIPGFSGGFIGVDVFFVVSGYLITSILVREHEETGRIDLLRFYSNRLRRLLPALAVMLAVCGFLAWRLLPLSEQPAQGKAGAMAAFWISNLFFAYSDVDYFATETSGNVFLHTWSLGVEEQFYLLWPLLILLAGPFVLGRTKRLAALWCVIACLSLILCLAWTNTQPRLAFYMMPARAWQFAVGALTWLCARHMPPSSTNAGIAGPAGIMLLAASLVLIDPSTQYPGLWALLPTLGCATLLWAGNNAATPVSRALSARPMQALGRLSYSLYLWHWPILAIGQRLLPLDGQLRNTVFVLGISLLATIATHSLIENPIRFGHPARLRHAWQLGLALGLMVLVDSLMLGWTANARRVLANAPNPSYHAINDVPVIYRDGCDDWFEDDKLNPCVYGSNNARRTAVLLGDSIGAQWFPALSGIFDSEEWRIVVLTKSSCPIVDERYFYRRIGRDYVECATWRERAIAWLEQNPAQVIFIGSSASYEFSREQWTQGTRRILDRLDPHTDAIYVIEANPTVAFDGPDCLSRRVREKCQGEPASTRYPQVAEYLHQAIAQQPKAHWLETASFVCPDGKCQAMRTIGGRDIVMFRDKQHLTASFAAAALEHFLNQVRVPQPARDHMSFNESEQ